MKAIINGETIELGSSGVTFTPSVSPEGELSWSNDGGLDNPEPVNIKGATGEPGNTPFIGENGNWWVGETDTGVAASGGNDDSGTTVFPVKAPVGAIVWWSGPVDTIPVGWHICDGQDGTIDLRDKFILAAGENHTVGEIGGEEEHKLTIAEMPSHKHSMTVLSNGSPSNFTPVLRGNASSTTIKNTEETGGNQPHNNMPPYYALYAIQKIGPDETDDSAVEGAIPVKPLTLEEYISLSDEEKSSETLWLITDVSDEVYPRTLDEASWNDIQKWSKSGALKANYSVGDKKTITIGGTFNGVTVPSTEIELVIAGFDHNQELETPGEHCTHFLLGWKDAHFIFMAGIAMYSYGQTNAGGWRDSLARSVLQNPTTGLRAILPPDLNRVMRSVKKYTNNVAGTDSVANPANITATDDDIAILSVFEALGITGTADVNEKDFQKTYDLLSREFAFEELIMSNFLGVNDQNLQWFRSPTLGSSYQYEMLYCSTETEMPGTAYVEGAAGILLFV